MSREVHAVVLRAAEGEVPSADLPCKVFIIFAKTVERVRRGPANALPRTYTTRLTNPLRLCRESIFEERKLSLVGFSG